MEIAGLTTSALALASLFNNLVDCFEYIQLGRSFRQSFQTQLLKLDVARLRLTRWGQAVGIAHLDDAHGLTQTKLAPHDVARAENILAQVQELFADAEGVSNRFRRRVTVAGSAGAGAGAGVGAGDRGILDVHDVGRDLDPRSGALHERMRELAVRRQGKVGVRQKAKWALYEEKHFSRLIEDVRGLVDDLVLAFPAVEEAQRKFSEAEVDELGRRDGGVGVGGAGDGGRGGLLLLREVVRGQDGFLSEALEKAVGGVLEEGGKQACHVTFSGDGNLGFQLGHNLGSVNNLHWGGESS